MLIAHDGVLLTITEPREWVLIIARSLPGPPPSDTLYRWRDEPPGLRGVVRKRPSRIPPVAPLPKPKPITKPAPSNPRPRRFYVMPAPDDPASIARRQRRLERFAHLLPKKL
jgi:hypothetical protein